MLTRFWYHDDLKISYEVTMGHILVIQENWKEMGFSNIPLSCSEAYEKGWVRISLTDGKACIDGLNINIVHKAACWLDKEYGFTELFFDEVENKEVKNIKPLLEEELYRFLRTGKIP